MSNQKKALEEILHKATAPKYAHQSLNLVSARMEEIGKIAYDALVIDHEPRLTSADR